MNKKVVTAKAIEPAATAMATATPTTGFLDQSKMSTEFTINENGGLVEISMDRYPDMEHSPVIFAAQPVTFIERRVFDSIPVNPMLALSVDDTKLLIKELSRELGFILSEEK